MPATINRRGKISKISFENLVLPGFDGVPINQVINLIFTGFKRGSFVTRASAIAFNFLLAIIPSLIFVFTLIPFVPFQNFQEELVNLFRNIMPENIFTLLESTIMDVTTNKSGGLMLTMLFATIYFSSNGFHAILHSFTVSEHSSYITRSWINQRKIAIFLFIGIVILISLAGCLVIFGKMIVSRLVEVGIIERSIVAILFSSLRWIVVVAMLLMAISSLYFFAPAKKKDYRFFSPGSITATLLFIVSALGFSAYVNNVGLYNILYGWLGTFLVVLAWAYLNAIALLIGFELNVSILDAKKRDLTNLTAK